MRLIWPDGSSEVPLMKAWNTRMVQKPSDHSANISFHLLTAQQSLHFCADPIKSSRPISCPRRFKEGSLIKLLINRPEQQRQELMHVLLGVGLFFEFQNSISPSLQNLIRRNGSTFCHCSDIAERARAWVHGHRDPACQQESGPELPEAQGLLANCWSWSSDGEDNYRKWEH